MLKFFHNKEKDMDKNRENSILNFIANCNEFLAGKFLFASSKLHAIYEDIKSSEPLDELFEQCNEGFNYSLESTKALIKTPTKAGYFTAPEELDKFLALVYGILKDIYEGVIDFNLFVTKYFSNDEKTPPTVKFGKEVIIPLKDTVAKYFELDETNEQKFALEAFEKPEPEIVAVEIEEEVEEELFDLEPIYYQIKTLSEKMLHLVKLEEKLPVSLKSDASFLLSEIIKACENEDIEKVYSLLIGFKYMQKNIKVLNGLMTHLLLVMAELENI